MRPAFRTALLRQRPVQCYLLGLGLIFIGAWSIEATGSLVPMSLAASAAVMLSLPLVRQLLARMRPRDID